MAGYNRIIMIGNLTRDPEYKQLASGQAVCRLSIASNRQFKNRQNGEMVQEVCYVDIDVWGAQAESCRQYLQKGRAVLVEGRLKLDSWQDQDGKTRSKHSIVADRVVFLSSSVVEDENSSQDSSSNPLEKEMLDQISQVKSRNDAKAFKAREESTFEKVEAVKPARSAVPRAEKKEVVQDDSFGDAEFKEFRDEPPFQDDLPF